MVCSMKYCHCRNKKNAIGQVLTTHPGRGGGVLPYMGYIDMCGPKGYGFSARFGHKYSVGCRF